jgi:ABC-type sugar transport system ATPase subunit
VKLVEPLGDGTLVFCEFGGESMLVAKIDSETVMTTGTKLNVSFDATRCHLFDASSGARLN